MLETYPYTKFFFEKLHLIVESYFIIVFGTFKLFCINGFKDVKKRLYGYVPDEKVTLPTFRYRHTKPETYQRIQNLYFISLNKFLKQTWKDETKSRIKFDFFKRKIARYLKRFLTDFGVLEMREVSNSTTIDLKPTRFGEITNSSLGNAWLALATDINTEYVDLVHCDLVNCRFQRKSSPK